MENLTSEELDKLLIDYLEGKFTDKDYVDAWNNNTMTKQSLRDFSLKKNKVKDGTISQYDMMELAQRYHLLLMIKLCEEHPSAQSVDSLKDKSFRLYEEKFKMLMNSEYMDGEIDYLKSLPSVKSGWGGAKRQKEIYDKYMYNDSPYFSEKQHDYNDIFKFNK